MKIKIGNKIYDSNKEPIMLIFETDESRKEVAEHLTNMEERDSIRKYLQFPAGYDMNKINNFKESDYEITQSI